MLEVFEARTELTQRFLEAFCHGECPKPDSMCIKVDDVEGERVNLSVWIKDKEGHELVKFCRFTVRKGDTMTVMKLHNMFEFKLSAA